MAPASRGSRNIFHLLESRAAQTSLEAHAGSPQGLYGRVRRTAQSQASLVRRLCLDTVLEAHTGCVNTIAWNKPGSLLVSGSDDTRVVVWDYAARRSLYSIDSGHLANIFCTKFLPETGDSVIISGAGDGEVRVHEISRESGRTRKDGVSSNRIGVFTCHAPRRVKKLAVEEGNPHMVWSASEDGTLRQHDLREGCEGGSDCRSVLLDLRGAAKRSLDEAPKQCLALKSCAISPTCPHYLLVGGSDPFARLYDRRMLPVPSSISRCQPIGKPPPCVSYMAPVHLAEHTRSWLHLTHVTFSPDGREALLSYSNEHVYLMDASPGGGGSMVYKETDLPNRFTFPALSSRETQLLRPPSVHKTSYGMASLQECEELLAMAKIGLREGSVGGLVYTIECCGDILEGNHKGYVLKSKLRYESLCVRASALVKRGWKGDAHMAIRDCNEARNIDSSSGKAYHIMAEALSQAGKAHLALEFAERAKELWPTIKEYSDNVHKLREKIGENRSNRKCKTTKDKSRGRVYSITSFVRAQMSRETTSSPTQGEGEAVEGEEEETPEENEGEEAEDERGGSADYESEIQLEVEDSPSNSREGVEEGRPSNNVEGDRSRERQIGLRLRWRQVDADREGLEREVIDTGGSTGISGVEEKVESCMDMRQRYVGHCNTGTDIKQASFLGERGDFIASGSDDGRWFIWEKRTARLVKVLAGDDNVVNCVQCHPFDCCIATSGIDESIKLWSPRAEAPSAVSGGPAGPEIGDTVRVMADNQDRMRRQREIGIPMELLQRLRVQEGMDGGHIQCNQS